MNRGASNIWPWLLLMPALILFSLFVLFPTIGNVYFSLTDYAGNIHNFDFVGLENYKRAFTADYDGVWNAIKITLIFCITVTILQNAISIVLAVLVNQKLKLSSFYRSTIFMPNILGILVVGLIWTLVFDPFSGPVSQLLNHFKINSALLGDSKIALALVIFVQVWAHMGYSMVLYLAGLQSIPKELYEAAYIDGASGWKSFRHVTLPLLQSMVTINIILMIIGTLGTFDIIFVLTNGGPNESTMTLGMYIFTKIFSGGSSQGYASALAMVQFVIIFCVVFIAQFYSRRRETEF
ncbi:carbohydrate ABC transporter permease [Fictibacillus fluitans]|uniref:Sugar ABC transporter permease n=1 Tax=Fictibacillus fluitans TaxID=3058422 RepID=A0ABT8HWL6_9BACL|nr:sugar ABC transporter permease [Fictibacillus sp. NE201]MDN4525179.1 sugar ABC transporter permease [Fictibacillus sp. NE201]